MLYTRLKFENKKLKKKVKSDMAACWRKNLYEKTGLQDNYTDPSFLTDLQTNLHVRFFTLAEAIKGVTILSNQLSCITGFLIVFYSISTNRIEPMSILWPSCIVTIVGYLLYRGSKLNIACFLDDSRTLLTVLLFGYLLAPVLHNLTDAISTDTIFYMTFFVMIVNLLFYDYGLSVAMVSNAVSLNAAIFGSICLASRLSGSYHAFVLLVESSIFFVLYPLLLREFWKPYFVIPIIILCAYTLVLLSMTALWVYLGTIIFINIICPCMFVLHQRYKKNIHGPWDEAIVEETTDYNIDGKL